MLLDPLQAAANAGPMTELIQVPARSLAETGSLLAQVLPHSPAGFRRLGLSFPSFSFRPQGRAPEAVGLGKLETALLGIAAAVDCAAVDSP
mmetsp:Transcript_34287/g.72673  ORF Transcript_34287/g.72673 Transcript_34287/m.72673 type:complete len:91 (-) Transcript_34287:828-1100(-)